MFLKVCGMREPSNIASVASLDPDLVGFIFYEQSPRSAVGIDALALKTVPKHKRVGVFVNESKDGILRKIQQYDLSYIQLHGDEPVELIKEILSVADVRVIKVFRVFDQLPLADMEPYEDVCSYFLMDTKSEKYGGSGKKFNWQILEGYHLRTPVIMSGGIDLDDIESIKNMG